jgi:hypothetical protein
MAKTLILIILGFHLGSLYGSDLYTSSDLEVLVAEGNHSEYFRHALEIRPSLRDEKWRENTSKMADLKAKEILNQAKIEESDLRELEALYEWPVLQSDDIFNLRRGQIGQKYFKACLKKDKSCSVEVLKFWRKNVNNPELGFSFAELGHEYSLPPSVIWEFLSPALKSPITEFHCKNNFIIQEVWRQLGKIHLELGPKSNFTHQIDSTLHPNCLPSLNSLAQQKLKDPDSELDRELAFSILAAQGKASEKIKDLFYTLYILENPSRGENFNLAWNRISELGKHADRREKLLTEIRSMTFLPDGIAQTLDKQKKKVVLRHLKANFPEYLDHYWRSCLHFYGGKGPFPKGNPTQNCEGLMKSDLASELFERSQINEFIETIKI